MSKYQKKYRKPRMGEAIHCWVKGQKYIAHQDMFYLGKDKEATDKVLVASPKYGWGTISLSDLPKGNYRVIGKHNILEKIPNKRGYTIGFVFVYFDDKKQIPITVKRIKGIWNIKQDFKMPSWIKEDLQG